jgi:hypothetical protein
MKSLVIALICSAISYMAIGQNVGIGIQTPHASAQLDVSSTTRGLLAPRMTTAQRNAIVNPAKGLLVYDTQENSLFHYNGSAWSAVGSGGGAAMPKVAFGMTGVHGSHLTVPHNSGRRVQYTGSDLYDLTQSYTPLVNTYDPTTSSTYQIPASGIYHFDLAVLITNATGLDFGEASAALSLKRNRNGNITTIAANTIGQKLVDNINHYILLDISRDFSLLAGDRIFVEIFQLNSDNKSFTISQAGSYFTGHLVTTL